MASSPNSSAVRSSDMKIGVSKIARSFVMYHMSTVDLSSCPWGRIFIDTRSTDADRDRLSLCRCGPLHTP